jgi:glycosyltransferase involved in cell wall biosynthesis
LRKKGLVVAAIPAYNEEATIAKVIVQTRKHVDRVIVCDDGSRDMTSEIATSMGITLVKHKRNLGKGSALRTLFNEAREINADTMITLDADGQHDPNEIPQLVRVMHASRADIVVGSRFMKGKNAKAGVPRYRVVGNKMLNALTDKEVSDTQSGFRVYSKAAIESLNPTEMGMGVDSEILVKAKQKGLKIVEVPIKVSYDVPKPSKQDSVSHTSDVILSVIKHYSIRRPLLFYGLPGLIALVISLIFWIWTIQTFTATRTLITNVTLIAIGATMVGLMLLTTAIILWVLVSVVRETSTTKK